jgi:hypothetical protein
MEKWNPGSHLVLECKEHGLWIMGYYEDSHRKKGLILLNVYKLTVYPITTPAVCFFLGTWDWGSSTPGPPYITKWLDQYGNVKQLLVPHPEIVRRFFSVSNKIDTHNQLRQHELALKEHWWHGMLPRILVESEEWVSRSSP